MNEKLKKNRNKRSNDWNIRNYDQFLTRVHKGQLQEINNYAKSIGESRNAMVCRLVNEEMESK